MTSRPILPNVRLAAVLIIGALIVFPGRSFAQGHGGGSRHNSTNSSDGGNNGPTTPEPYDGQIYCPVTGKKLGLTLPPVPVQTGIGEKQPGFWGKMFGQKPTPGVVIYVCCPECAERVRREPMTYLGEIVADKACFNFTYAKAPAQRPPRVRDEEEPTASVLPGANQPPPTPDRPGTAPRP